MLDVCCSALCIDLIDVITRMCVYMRLCVCRSYDRDISTKGGKPKIIAYTQATLVIVPTALVSQWVSEIKKCAPELKVAEYVEMDFIHGRCCRVCPVGKCKPRCVHRDCQNRCTRGHLETRLAAFAQSVDVVISTYQVLKGKKKSKKHVAKHSPLRRIHWRRIVLDEMQEVNLCRRGSVGQR